MLFSSTVPNTFAQMLTWHHARSKTVQTACVECGAITTGRDWCNACQERLLTAARARWLGYTREALLSRLRMLRAKCECGRDKPRGAIRCSHCAWMERGDQSDSHR